MFPFIVIFLLAGLGLVVAGRHLEQQARQASQWPRVVGTLEHCEVVEVPGMRAEEASSWRLQIRYAYVVKGKTYHATRYAFGYGDSQDDDKLRNVANDLQSRSELWVRYDPKHPSEAVICTDAPTGITSIGYWLLAMAVMAALIWMGCR
ncbi:MAG: DUF3592 domain-containing protein [Betaproteobacteria bacterium]|nr:DUF3592 domain-containing protein [Betaproteobacteria bacterium]